MKTCDPVVTLRAGGILDGAESLEQAAGQAEKFAAYIRWLASRGWDLVMSPAEDDHVFIRL